MTNHRELIRSARAYLNGLHGNTALKVGPNMLANMLADVTNALEASEAQCVEVKPLEWWVSDTGDACCDTPLGRYQIQKGGSRYCMMPAMALWRKERLDDPVSPSYHRTEKSAKAAAQSDYERRILSAISARSASGVRAEATAAALGAAADALDEDSYADIAAIETLTTADAAAWLQRREDEVREECAVIADRFDTGDMTREDMEARRIAAAIRTSKGGEQ